MVRDSGLLFTGNGSILIAFNSGTDNDGSGAQWSDFYEARARFASFDASDLSVNGFFEMQDYYGHAASVAERQLAPSNTI